MPPQEDTRIRIIVGASGLIASPLLYQLRALGTVIAASRHKHVGYAGDTEIESLTLGEIITRLGIAPRSASVLLSFRSRSRKSLDESCCRVSELIKTLEGLGTSKIRLIFLNSVCASLNEPTQDLFYHLEKSLMKRMHMWYTDQRRIESSINITLHVVPREKPLLDSLVRSIVRVVLLQEEVNLNGSEIYLERAHCYSAVQ
jgi:hypothetical protein